MLKVRITTLFNEGRPAYSWSTFSGQPMLEAYKAKQLRKPEVKNIYFKEVSRYAS